MKSTRVTFFVEKEGLGIKSVIFEVNHEDDSDPSEVVKQEFDFSGVIIKTIKIESMALKRVEQVGGSLIAMRKRS